MISDDLICLLQQCGTSDQVKSQQSKIAMSLSSFIDNKALEGDSIEAIALGIETTLVKNDKSSIVLAKLCAHLQRLTGNIKSTELGYILMGAAPEQVRSVSWIIKLIKAGDLLLKWPQLEHISSIDKLATLRRIPKKLQNEIFDSGFLPDGRDFRSLSRGELAEAVGSLRSPGQSPVPPNPYRQARQKLIKLVADFGPLCESLAVLPAYSSISEQVQEIQKRLVKIVEETAVTPRVMPQLFSQEIA